MATKGFASPQVETFLLFAADPSKWQIDDAWSVFVDPYRNPYTNKPAFLFPWYTGLSRGEKIRIKFRPRFSAVPNAEPVPHPLDVLFPPGAVVQRVEQEFFPAEGVVRVYGFCGSLHNEVMTASLLLELGRLEVFYGYADNQVRFSELLSRIGISLSRGSGARKEAA
jgi:hypothetical protein